MNGHVKPFKAVDLSTLDPGDVFTVVGDGVTRRHPRRYQLIEHAKASSVVRQFIQPEQIEFTRSDGTPVDFLTRLAHTERFSSRTRVVVR